MGSSIWHSISYNIDLIRKITPNTVLDIGIGFGKWGFLSREYLDVFNERVHSMHWKVRIDGIEIFERNIEEHQKKIYSNIFICDAIEFLDKLNDKYDLIIIGDVLEHFQTKEAYKLLSLCIRKGKFVMLNIPVGNFWPQESMYGNVYERHLSVWQKKDFSNFRKIKQKKFYYSFLRPYYVILFSKHETLSSSKCLLKEDVYLFLEIHKAVAKIIEPLFRILRK